MPLSSSPAVRPVTPCASGIPKWKRLVDLSICTITLPLTLPIFCAIALTIKSLSRGPVLFRQQRIGYRGKAFTCYKFRTMRADARPDVHQVYTASLSGSKEPMTKMDLKGDKRLLPLAWIVRSLGLDELPQLINVVKGEMSLVGPRPCVPAEFEADIEAHQRRFVTLPGITGLWQVSGKNRTTFDQMVVLDERYARERSVGMDMVILAKTPYAIVDQFLESRRGRIDVHCRQDRGKRGLANG